MSEADNNMQSKEKKNSRLAVASFITPVLMWDIGWLFAGVPLLIPSLFNWLPTEFILFCSWVFLCTFLIFLSSPMGMILAVLSLMSIRKSSGKLEGKHYAIKAVILSVVLFILSVLLGRVFLMIMLYWKELGVE